MSILIKGIEMPQERMSVSLWAYEPITCDNEFCCGDCDSCNHIPSHETDFYDFNEEEVEDG